MVTHFKVYRTHAYIHSLPEASLYVLSISLSHLSYLISFTSDCPIMLSDDVNIMSYCQTHSYTGKHRHIWAHARNLKKLEVKAKTISHSKNMQSTSSQATTPIGDGIFLHCFFMFVLAIFSCNHMANTLAAIDSITHQSIYCTW